MLNVTRPVFTELGTQAIDKGLADPQLSAFYESMMSESGIVTEKLREHMPYLSLCSDQLEGFGPPPIFYVGRRSSQRLLFGDDWALQQGQALRTPDPDLEYASADGYRCALAGRPYYGYARTTIQFQGTSVDIAFERLILTLRPSQQSGRRFCAYFGVIQDLHQLQQL
ncbi:hypothetical protein JM93_00263 [Roseibium hamelinense]|uniref:PAS domain-containing protein n=1 Tax=Roseibium hamelinense TaxID=150831 RepID=A0A562THR1_9HYPH|nr:hypothetical protein [Roseibium hamelinense]TWI92718.1 hypothetical protein JM93_00263 [Roseibium hamelinense]